MKKAIFLDRDGVLLDNKDGYVHKIEDIELFSYSRRVLNDFKNLGYYNIVITNQGGVAFSYYTEKDVKEINNYLMKILRIDKIYYCPHHPDGTNKYKRECYYRKPGHGSFIEAKIKYNINLVDSWMIGDKLSDILSGKKARCKTVLVRTGCGKEEEKKIKKIGIRPDFIVDNLECAYKIVK